MKIIVNTVCFIVSLLAFQYRAFAWDDAGHIIIAAEAFRQLSPELQAQAIEVLKAHPDYAEWAKAYHPKPDYDLAAYVFMRSSTWPDEIRRSGSPYDHPEWHFIDYPLQAPSFPLEPDARPTNDVLYGVAQCEKILGDTNADPELRAADLSFLVHLIGDMHQPLHCASFFSPDYTNGDRGGNDFYVKLDGQGVRLHGIWDGLLGTAGNPGEQWKYAVQIDHEFPRAGLPELTRHLTPREWSLEGRELAIEKGYLHGNLTGSKDADSAPPLPDGYLKAAKAVAERQVALAGYRLADEIQTYLKTSGPVPLLPANTNVVAEVLPQSIGTADANKYYDESMIVTGKVVQISVKSSVNILDLDQPFPATPFTAIVFNDHLGKFGDLQKFQNKNVEISGTITEYRHKPEIVLESPSQIKVTDGQ